MQYSLGTPLPGVLFSKRQLWNRHHWQRGEEAVAGHDGAHFHLPKLSAQRAGRVIGIDEGRSISAIREEGEDQRV